MSTSMPKPPVPVPPPPQTNFLNASDTSESKNNNNNCSFVKHLHIDECLWANCNQEIQQACYLAKVCTQSPPKCCRFQDIQSILQEGPTCGIVAVSMLFNGNPTPNDILKLAKQKNYTNNGEMFSALNLYELICDIATSNSDKIQCQLFLGRVFCARVIEALQSGACILIPYDSDFNHSPCLKNGHKSHWALLIGYLIDDNDEFYVISRHGKVKNLAVWSLKSLSESNSNLKEFAQPKGYPDMSFLLPPGGISGNYGLLNQSVIVESQLNETIVVV